MTIFSKDLIVENKKKMQKNNFTFLHVCVSMMAAELAVSTSLYVFVFHLGLIRTRSDYPPLTILFTSAMKEEIIFRIFEPS